MASEFKHTPGPWAFVDCDDHEIDVSGSWDEDGEGYVVTETAMIGSYDGSLAIAVIGMNWPNHWDSESVDANVKLISAAPELLKVVQDIEESLTADDTYRLLREACREIIAKATGAA